MIKLFINNIPIQVLPNTSIIEACEKLGILIPRFCYHENLNVAGNCRMCLIEIENLPKPVAACAYPAINQLKIFTNTPLVKKARENVLEFLLINHPLDCPICDQGGECDLQEQTLIFGTNKSRFFFAKRTVEDINCSPLIKLIMTRCIHCTRCVRFFQEICNTEKLGTIGRGTKTEISLFINNKLTSELSGNIIDLCPVGALTSKTYAFNTRPWELTTNKTIDPNDALGSKIKINLKGNEIIRILPLKNSENTQWITDKTRFFFDGLQINRITKPYQIYNNQFFILKWNRVLKIFTNLFLNLQINHPLSNLIVIGNNLSLESLETLKRISYLFNLPIISESLIQISTNQKYYNINNISIDNLLQTDLILFIGINPRIESNLYNLKLKFCKKQKTKLIIATIGLTENLLYKNLYLGNSLKNILKILEGKHKFCQQISQAKIPAIIFGSNLQNRIDFKHIKKNIYFFNKFYITFSNHTIEYGLMNSDFNETGINNVLTNTLIDLNKIKTILIFDSNNLNKIYSKLPNIKQIFLYTTNKPQINNKKIKMYLPITTFLEEKEHFLNYNGILQKTHKIIKNSTLIRSTTLITKAILALFNILPYNFNSKYYVTKPLKYFDQNLVKNEFLYKNKKKRYYKNILKAKTNNLFQSTAINFNSRQLAKLTLNSRKNYNNFI